MSLEQLLIACKKNDSKAQEQLYRQLSPKLFAVCLKYSRNYAEAQDNLQEGFLLIFKNIVKFDGRGSFEGWAKRVVINNVLQQYRKNGFLEIVTENIPDEADVIVETDAISLEYLLQIIQELPDRYRLVFNLFVIDGYNHKEISELLSIAIGSSKSNLARARLLLKEKIEALNSQKIPSAK